ncbi:MAG: hypothetical protein M1839_009435 [Geoglossum umbratile]|nr:MAG: hypothetical protein M1839_009435 [Geoglossum umbratile]
MVRQLPNEDGKSTPNLSAYMKSEPGTPSELASSREVEKGNLAEQGERGVQDDPPDGGLIAWLQVFAGFLLVVNSRGLTNTFGVYQEYYSREQLRGTNPSTISWIGSIQTFLLMFGGVFCGRLLDAGHLRVQLCAGITLQFVGTVLTSFATEYWQILIAQGFCVGMGSSFLWLPSVVVIAQYFDSKIMLATGIAATGSSAAGVIYPILVHKLMDQIGYSWAVRVMAFIVLAMNVVCLAIMRLRVPPRRGGKFFDLSMFRDPPYTMFVAAMTFLYAAVYIPFFYIQDYSRDSGMSGKWQLYVLSILNAASLVSRILPSWVADMIGGLNVLIPCCLVSCASIFALSGVTSTAGIISIVIIYGLFSGALVSLPPATIASISKNPDEYGTRIGMAFAVCSFGVLVGNPIAGALLSTPTINGGANHAAAYWMRLWFFAGGLMFVAGALVGLTRYLVVYYAEDEVESESEVECGDEGEEKDGTPPSPDELDKEDVRSRISYAASIPRSRRRWHQILVEDAVAMQGLSVW